MEEVKNRNDGLYKEADGQSKEEWKVGNTNDGIGPGCPDGTHPSDYSKGKKPNDMRPSKMDGNV